MGCRSILAIPAAGVGFFFSAWVLMIGAGAFASDVGIKPFGYSTSMFVTIILWVTMAPVVGAIARAQTTPLIFRRGGRTLNVD